MNDHMPIDEINEALGALTVPVPDAVARYEVQVGRDSTDDPAVWVYVVVNDDKIEPLRPKWRQLRWDIYETIARLAGAGVNTYVRMRATSELEGVGARAS
jgi:hypothetical protein